MKKLCKKCKEYKNVDYEFFSFDSAVCIPCKAPKFINAERYININNLEGGQANDKKE